MACLQRAARALGVSVAARVARLWGAVQQHGGGPTLLEKGPSAVVG